MRSMIELLFDERYEVVPKKEYKKEILENRKLNLERNVKALTNSLADVSEELEKVKKELKDLEKSKT